MPQVPIPAGVTGLAGVWELPDAAWEESWTHIFLDPATKQRLLNYAVFVLLNSAGRSSVRFPLHRVALLAGPPGTGKTTLARGLAQQAARIVKERGGARTVLVDVDTHAFTSELLGASQRNVATLLGRTIPDLASDGDPLVVLIDEIENIATSRSMMSMQTNPVDVHRATNAVLTGIDELAAAFPNILLVCTTNFTESLDPALLSRLDLMIATDLPDRQQSARILADTMAAVRGGEVPESDGLEAVLDAAAGLDARQLRKLALEGVISREELVWAPERLDWDDLLGVLKQRG